MSTLQSCDVHTVSYLVILCERHSFDGVHRVAPTCVLNQKIKQ